jgi:hypothetical protein
VAITFDGVNKLAILSTGTTTLSVLDLYSRWVDWLLTGDNSKYLPMFSTVGGDPIDATAGTSVPTYAFLQNGWRIRPQETNHTLSVTGGVILVAGGGDPFVDTVGNFVVRINYSQPVQAVTITTNTGGGIGTVAQVADAVWSANNLGAYGVGTAGQKLDSVGAAANPWNTDLSTYTTANTAGKILKDAGLDATLAKTQTDTVEGTLATLQGTIATLPVDIRTEMDANSVKLAQIKAIIDSMTIPTAAQNADAVWTAPVSTMTNKTTIGGWIHKVILSIPFFMGTK